MPSADMHVRPITEAELGRFLEIDRFTFLETAVSAEMDAWQRRFLELDRCVGLFDGDTQVGDAAIMTTAVTVPEGRQVPLAAVTWVSVLPTHRRRGGLTKLMRHQLHTLHETGAEPLAGLRASQAGIYGRFGYGLATQSLELTIPREASALRLPPGTDDVTVRLADPKANVAVFREHYDRHLLERPGMLRKPDWWVEFDVADLDGMRGGQTPLRCLIAQRAGETTGYALYRVRPDDRETTVHVSHLYADDPASYAALWRLLTSVDLSFYTATKEIHLPIDAPLLSMLQDPRSAQPRLRDQLHLRLVDLDRALAARTYGAPIDVVLEVVDEFCPWNAGRWRLSGDEKGGECARTDSPADLTVGVRELGSAYLGGETLRSRERAGLVTEHTTGAVAATSRAFATDIAPWLSLGI